MENNNFDVKFCVYKYVYEGEIIYIGKTNKSLMARVKSHYTEPKFSPYKFESKIYYIELKNRTETDVFEKLLINKYKPILNIAEKYEDTSIIDIGELNWVPLKFNDNFKAIIENLPKSINVLININQKEISKNEVNNKEELNSKFLNECKSLKGERFYKDNQFILQNLFTSNMDLNNYKYRTNGINVLNKWLKYAYPNFEYQIVSYRDNRRSIDGKPNKNLKKHYWTVDLKKDI